MTGFSDFAHRLVAGFGAVAITAVMFTSYFAYPAASAAASLVA